MTNNTDPVLEPTTPDVPVTSPPEEPVTTEQVSPISEGTVSPTEEPSVPEVSVTPSPSMMSDPIKDEPMEVTPPVELSSDAKCRPSLSLILFVIFIGIITFILGFLASSLLTTDDGDDGPTITPTVTETVEPTVEVTDTPTIVEEVWIEYTNDELNFKFTYPEDWEIEYNSNLSADTYTVSDGEYGLVIQIIEGWGPEGCVYEDTTTDLTGLDPMYTEFDNFIEIEGVDMIYRRSQLEDGSIKICARDLDSTNDYFGDLAFMWPSDNGTTSTGSIRYIVPPLYDIGDDGIGYLDRILASLEGI